MGGQFGEWAQNNLASDVLERTTSQSGANAEEAVIQQVDSSTTPRSLFGYAVWHWIWQTEGSLWNSICLSHHTLYPLQSTIFPISLFLELACIKSFFHSLFYFLDNVHLFAFYLLELLTRRSKEGELKVTTMYQNYRRCATVTCH